jgi:RNA polymerase sigma-70 factor (ECF subfamily)
MMDEITKVIATDLDGGFRSIVEHMAPRLYWGLRRMSNTHHEAEDLTQEVFIRAYNALDGYDRPRIETLKLEPWLWTIALNLGRNNARDKARRPTPVELTEAPIEDPEVHDGRAWDRRLASLSGPQRTAVVLRHVVGLGISEIAAATGRPEGTVKADIHRGLNRLKEVMEEER